LGWLIQNSLNLATAVNLLPWATWQQARAEEDDSLSATGSFTGLNRWNQRKTSRCSALDAGQHLSERLVSSDSFVCMASSSRVVAAIAARRSLIRRPVDVRAFRGTASRDHFDIRRRDLDAQQLAQRLRDADFDFWVKGKGLCVSPASRLTETLRARIREQLPGLLEIARREHAGEPWR
jgi:hypothetical protein